MTDHTAHKVQNMYYLLSPPLWKKFADPPSYIRISQKWDKELAEVIYQGNAGTEVKRGRTWKGRRPSQGMTAGKAPACREPRRSTSLEPGVAPTVPEEGSRCELKQSPQKQSQAQGTVSSTLGTFQC